MSFKSLSPLALLLVSACSLAPSYHAPQTAAPVQFKEMPGWALASPQDSISRGPWWYAFNDADLNALETRAAAASPTLEAALARYDAAQATARQYASALYPQLDTSGYAQRQRVSENRPLTSDRDPTYDDYSLGASASYEIDLWGRVRNTVKAGRAQAEASGDDLASAQLSLQAQVADAYVRLRGLDAQADLLRRSVTAFQRAVDLTQKRHDGGVASGIDVNRARTVLGNARAQVSAIANQRAATEHELAALVGAIASDFSVAPRTDMPIPPDMPASTPSQLLQRRPDIAAAERRVFAANAQIGVAKAAFFPAITLDSSVGVRTTGDALFSMPSLFWGLGPISAALNIFDGGARRAKLRISRAQYHETVANYRSTVLTAFRQTEDSLAAITHLKDQADAQQAAAVAAEKTSDIAMARYRDGASDYLDVVTAQTDALVAQRSYIAVETQRMQAAIAYILAIGGDPASDTPRSPPAPS